MGMFLEQIGKRADLVTADRIPVVYRKLPGADRIRTALRVHGPYDAAILLECDSAERTQLRGLERFTILNIDHHASGRAWGQVNWIDREAASVGELVYRLDQGSRGQPHSRNCHVPLHNAAHRYRRLYLWRSSRFHLRPGRGADPRRRRSDSNLQRHLLPHAHVEIAAARRRAQQSSPRRAPGMAVDHAQRHGAHLCSGEEDCEGIVNYALSIADVEAAVFLRELPEQRIRMSLRSKGKVNVAAIAESLGGGGHENASGCTVDGPLARALEEILAVLRPCVACGAAKQESRSG
jgi:phosphoesterase RecJ-like protein